MIKFLDTPLFGILISILAFEIGIFINKKTKLSILNPIVIAEVLIIVFMIVFNIDYEVYNKGGSIISFFLGPATVVLAVPLYKQIEKLKENGLPIMVGIAVGCITAITSVYFLSKLFHLDEVLTLSLLPKSVTAAISMEVSSQIGGIPALTVAATVVTGITGNVLWPYISKVFKIENDVASGISLGTSAHALGTAKAMELGEVEGGMASLAIGVAGLVTVILVPILAKLLF
ncbi:LrgB family protein [Sporanaerobacter acetigenes]|uniref:TIGR00659 family protein n=1 Tax=Sporanaerobacter acetigenes DSM 13106 TaxID=1123281 RepID=A0A1M5WHE2_9FIRM|nr:LrgB family protein [Sporanaerobacter acetigenes]SHH86916.1 TIGR00659 family protein [Sporanaerobacter acetigenes DSM 13106]